MSIVTCAVLSVTVFVTLLVMSYWCLGGSRQQVGAPALLGHGCLAWLWLAICSNPPVVYLLLARPPLRLCRGNANRWTRDTADAAAAVAICLLCRASVHCGWCCASVQSVIDTGQGKAHVPSGWPCWPWLAGAVLLSRPDCPCAVAGGGPGWSLGPGTAVSDVGCQVRLRYAS